jgi:hypothetical protein
MSTTATEEPPRVPPTNAPPPASILHPRNLLHPNDINIPTIVREKYHPVDSAGNPLHAKIMDPTLSNPHHTYLDLHHPSPVRTPSPSKTLVPRFGAVKSGTTEKMKIDKYSDGKIHILVGATGSVASVKIPLIVKSLLAHESVEVQVVVTKTAKHFFDVVKLKKELNVKVWEDEDDWKVPIHPRQRRGC